MKIIFVLISIALTSITNAQDWKMYPYSPDAESQVKFPIDEGRHPSEGIEWWYTTGDFTGLETGNEYTFMLTYFYYENPFTDGFRILNVSNETAGEFYSDMQLCNYPFLSEYNLHIIADLPSHLEYWHTKIDTSGEFLPFEYELEAQSPNGAIDFSYNTIKRPLILGGDGLFPQGVDNYTYYYSQTGIELSGTFSIGTITEEVEGTAWIDRQYGSFNPATGEKYEWFSMQLSNGMDINLWNIFDDQNNIPDTATYRFLSAYVDEDHSFTVADFSIERLKYDFVPGTDRVYAQQWRLLSDTMEMNLIITTQNPENEVLLPFKFFEGSTSIEGTINGVPVTGKGFAELLHTYKHPEVEFLAPVPDEAWTLQQPIKWTLGNPDEGRPIYYDLSVKSVNSDEYEVIAQTLEETSYLWDAVGFSQDEAYTFQIFAYSIDTTLHSEVETQSPVFLPVIEKNDWPEISISPNPVSKQLKVRWEYGTPITIPQSWQLLNAQGKLVESQKIYSQSNAFELEVSHLPTGMYKLILLTKEGRSIAKPVIIAR